jgi:hypothetical protein
MATSSSFQDDCCNCKRKQIVDYIEKRWSKNFYSTMFDFGHFTCEICREHFDDIHLTFANKSYCSVKCIEKRADKCSICLEKLSDVDLVAEWDHMPLHICSIKCLDKVLDDHMISQETYARLIKNCMNMEEVD